MGMGFAPTWLRQVSPPASQNHFNHCASALVVDRVEICITSSSIAVQNLFFFSYRVRACRMSLGWCAVDPLKHATLPPVLPRQIQPFCVKPFERNYGVYWQKILTPHAPPFKVTGSDTYRSATCDFLLSDPEYIPWAHLVPFPR